MNFDVERRVNWEYGFFVGRVSMDTMLTLNFGWMYSQQCTNIIIHISTFFTLRC